MSINSIRKCMHDEMWWIKNKYSNEWITQWMMPYFLNCLRLWHKIDKRTVLADCWGAGVFCKNKIVPVPSEEEPMSSSRIWTRPQGSRSTWWYISAEKGHEKQVEAAIFHDTKWTESSFSLQQMNSPIYVTIQHDLGRAARPRPPIQQCLKAQKVWIGCVKSCNCRRGKTII